MSPFSGDLRAFKFSNASEREAGDMIGNAFYIGWVEALGSNGGYYSLSREMVQALPNDAHNDKEYFLAFLSLRGLFFSQKFADDTYHV